MNFFSIELFALAAILSSLLVITSQNSVISVLYLISAFVCSAIYLFWSGVWFIGISYIIVYVGAIAILFLFILMMINIQQSDISEAGPAYTQNLPLGLLLVALFLYLIFTIVPFSFGNISLSSPFDLLSGLVSGSNTTEIFTNVHLTVNPVIPDNQLTEFSQVEGLAQGLYSSGAALLMVTSFILLLSMLSPIILSNVYNVKNIEEKSTTNLKK